MCASGRCSYPSSAWSPDDVPLETSPTRKPPGRHPVLQALRPRPGRRGVLARLFLPAFRVPRVCGSPWGRRPLEQTQLRDESRRRRDVTPWGLPVTLQAHKV